MLDDAHYWAAAQFGSADLGDARRTGRLVSTMAAIARAPDESLPRQLGSIAGAKAAYRLFDCGAVTREAVMDPHLAQCRAAAARHPVVLMVHDDTTLDFSTHRRLQGAGRVGDDHGTGFQLPGRAALGRDAGPGPPDDLGAASQGRDATNPRVRGLGRHSRDNRPSAGGQPLRLGRGPWRRHLRASGERSRDQLGRGRAGGPGQTSGHRRRLADGAARGPRDGRVHGSDPAGRSGRLRGLARPGASAAAQRSGAPIRVSGVRVWNDTLEWLLLTTRPVESLDQALEIIAWYARRWTVEEFCCAALRVTRPGKPAAGPSSGSWRRPIGWCRCSGRWPSSLFVSSVCAMPPSVTAVLRRTCRRRRSGSSPPSFSNRQSASPPTATSCAASPAWAAFSLARPTANPAGRRSGRAGSSS